MPTTHTPKRQRLEEIIRRLMAGDINEDTAIETIATLRFSPTAEEEVQNVDFAMLAMLTDEEENEDARVRNAAGWPTCDGPVDREDFRPWHERCS